MLTDMAEDNEPSPKHQFYPVFQFLHAVLAICIDYDEFPSESSWRGPIRRKGTGALLFRGLFFGNSL